MPLRSSPPTPARAGRWLLCSLLSLSLAACGQGSSSQAKEPQGLSSQGAVLGEARIRLMAANITSGNNQSYDPGHGIRIFQGTKPDVVMIQEFKYGANSDADIRAFVDTAFGSNFHYYREPQSGGIPNGVISRYPILAAGEWEDSSAPDRDFAWARIDIPGPKDLWVVSVHLLTASSGTRNTEANQLVNYIQQHVPAGDFLAIAGDYNTDSRNESCFPTFSAVVSTSGPHPVAQDNKEGTNASRAKPYDHVLVSNNLRAYQTPTVIGASSFSAGLVVDTRVYSPIEEIAPAQSGDSGVTGMQHMAVIKDFLVPSDDPTTPVPTGRVTVVVPNGGESWSAGSTRSIAWTASESTHVKLEYTTDGSTWNVIADSIPAAEGGYTWQVPASATTKARVRVSDASEAAVADTSDADFAITSTPPQDTRAPITQETEANNSVATASGRVGADKNVSGTLSSGTDVDWFAFNVTTAGSVKVKLSMSGAQDLDWYVYSASDLFFSAASSATMSNPEVGTFSASAPGIYYVKVVGYAGATGAYTLNVSGAGVQP
ncbi:endonuclease/exonuclease/phosphatase family protein [Cystobacter ferrugineus]|uniref:Uncharacterized protein n=1 Tax=Cystobacter ferrugineus TaxID=83449 RepID=A0A1L9B6K0_9BACT|nr:endonuclease/exonuclease/phosphatase family protein [Cystobacter ferrugineus]OJH37884.1 hypothetical protein BON30_27365 [Cystobacter ferrugineus]